MMMTVMSIYLLLVSFLDPEMHYAHVEKLELAAVQAVQCFRHYILLRTMKDF